MDLSNKIGCSLPHVVNFVIGLGYSYEVHHATGMKSQEFLTEPFVLQISETRSEHLKIIATCFRKPLEFAEEELD